MKQARASSDQEAWLHGAPEALGGLGSMLLAERSEPSFWAQCNLAAESGQ